MTIRYKVIIASCILSFPLITSAGQDTVYQNCLLEGKVIADKKSDGSNTVRIDFYKAQPYKPGARCIIDGVLEFTQPKGSIIENLSEGSVVQYHYMKDDKGQATWQLVGAFI